MSEHPIIPKEYYSISEVCELTGLKPHVLRYWESQFPGLSPSRNRAGNRVYLRKDVKLILLVKELLYTEGYTIQGAKRKLAEAANQALDREMATLIQTELNELLEILTPDATVEAS